MFEKDPFPPAISAKAPESIRLYVTLKKATDSNIEYKKLILMTSSSFL